MRLSAKIGIILKKNTKMIITVEHKQYMVGTYIHFNVVHKFRYEQEFCLIVFLPINKLTKISFYHAIMHLNLTLCLQIKNSKKLPLDAEKVT